MGLHTEGRTSLITHDLWHRITQAFTDGRVVHGYWLPDILTHEHIALQFLPLTITPVPDVMTRVFVFFRGVQPDDLHLWDSCTTDVNWTEVVGVDA